MNAPNTPAAIAALNALSSHRDTLAKHIRTLLQAPGVADWVKVEKMAEIKKDVEAAK